MNVLALIATGAAVLVSVPSVLSHGYIVDPAAQWRLGYPENGYGSMVDNEIWGAVDYSVYGYGPEGQVAFFQAKFPDSGYDSMGEFIMTNQDLYSNDTDPECGYTIYDDSKRSTLPASTITYSGFTHPGPCEIWCDDTKILFDYNCQATYSDIPATVAYDETQCANANRLTIYWIGLHGVPWQVYTDCVWLEESSSSGSAPSAVDEGASSTTTSNSTTTTTATTAPTTVTTAPASTPATSTETITALVVTSTGSSAAGEAETKATSAPPIATTEAPAATSGAGKCSRRGRN
ncbi:hypothetical protein BBJ28_00006020 [Nothophytophthora sp. Chile5]|nr:hypothetical protein BBJ28_00006020 [Nothophytophthora sp. Chile5]